MNVLDVQDLRVRFDTDEGPVLAVNGLSLSIAESEVLAVVGESGCGKTVTALAVMGLAPAHAHIDGSIRLAGTELTTLPDPELRRIRGRDLAMIFQEPMTSLNPAFTIGRQIGEVLVRHEGLSKRAARIRTVELLDLVRIPSAARRLDEYPHQLSGGMRQRVMIAIAVACNPKLIIADEPTTALDVTIQAQVLDILRQLRRDLGTAVLLITHDLGVVADIADRVVVMYAGHAVERGEAEALFTGPQHPYTIGLLGAVPRPGGARLTEIPGLVPVLREDPRACVFAPRCARAADDCRLEMPPVRETSAGQFAACLHPGPKEAVLS
ncbi:ABC transporter ATP-binding protein [Pseudonocardia acaciae]|uniref:ABC transporter ATP-binding protein n=1 Tax=Pseudonocardia acaciae TaxID=551276 RepID=UPI0004900C6C|nr:ABC transporter ATP-binding protein [Pseudonocardia acaciae]